MNGKKKFRPRWQSVLWKLAAIILIVAFLVGSGLYQMSPERAIIDIWEEHWGTPQTIRCLETVQAGVQRNRWHRLYFVASENVVGLAVPTFDWAKGWGNVTVGNYIDDRAWGVEGPLYIVVFGLGDRWFAAGRVDGFPEEAQLMLRPGEETAEGWNLWEEPTTVDEEDWFEEDGKRYFYMELPWEGIHSPYYYQGQGTLLDQDGTVLEQTSFFLNYWAG